MPHGRAVNCSLPLRSEATGSAEKKCEAEAARAVAPTAAAVTKNKDDADAVAKHEADAVESRPSVKCQLKALDAKPAALFEVQDCLTCGDVKRKIAKRYCIPAEQQVLYVGVKKLEDKWLCKDYIGTGTFVKLSMQMCGGNPPSVGEEAWWTARPQLEVKTADTPFTSNSRTRRFAIQKLKGLDDKKLEGWHAKERGSGVLCWHENAPRYYSNITRVRSELGVAAPPRKNSGRGFTPAHVEKYQAKAKKEQTGNFAPGYWNRPEVVEGLSKASRRQIFLNAKAGTRVGTSNTTRSGLYTCEFIGELYALQYIGLFSPAIRPLICCCELWHLSEKYGIEIEWERRRTASKSLTFFRIYDSVIPLRALYLFRYRFTGFSSVLRVRNSIVAQVVRLDGGHVVERRGLARGLGRRRGAAQGARLRGLR